MPVSHSQFIAPPFSCVKNRLKQKHFFFTDKKNVKKAEILKTMFPSEKTFAGIKFQVNNHRDGMSRLEVAFKVAPFPILMRVQSAAATSQSAANVYI